MISWRSCLSQLIGLALMKTDKISTGYEKGRKFLDINGIGTFLSPLTPDYPRYICEEVLEISDKV